MAASCWSASPTPASASRPTRSATCSNGSGALEAAPLNRYPGPAWASRSLSRSSRCMAARYGSRAQSVTVRRSISPSPWQWRPRRHSSAAMPELVPAGGGYGPSMVLVADDNEVAQRLCRRVLEKAGYGVLIASDGLQAVDLALAQNPNVILMDVAMPGMDGLEAMRKIKAERPEMRIVIASAHSMASDRQRFLAAGADDVLSKPFRLGDLIAVVAKLTAKPSA